MRLYNTLSKKVEDFNTNATRETTIYTCGPTVYDYLTIGNLRSYITADTLNRTLRVNKFKVKHVMNITDVDDKTIKRSRVDYSDLEPMEALKKLTDKYEDIFKKDLVSVGIDPQIYEFISATKSIKLMQDLILELLKKDFAYLSDDGIYFSIDKYRLRGKKYGQLLEIDISNTSKQRINNDEYDKSSVHDFALWKFAKINEPRWNFLINGIDHPGRPGWHIECSAMSTSILGMPFDIHTGGVDLIFPHHENEIAQSTAASEEGVYAKFFVHNEHLMVNKQKISKSKGNAITIEQIKEKGYEAEAFRLLILQSHYRTHSDFSWELMQQAQNRYNNLKNFAALRFQPSDSANTEIDFEKKIIYLSELLSDDLNTPKFLAEVSSCINIIEQALLSSDKTDDFSNFIKYIDSVTGLNLSSVKDLSQDVKEIILERSEVRKNKQWDKSDKLRDDLLKLKIGINDKNSQQIWYRVFN